MTIIENTLATVAVTVTAPVETEEQHAHRSALLDTIAAQAYNAENGKARFIAALAEALGDSPSPDELAFARVEVIIGVAAVRMPADELPKDCTTIVARLLFVRSLVLEYQAPSQAVTGTVRKLNKGMIGRRSAGQHRTIRNAETRAGAYLAELGEGNAKTDKEGNEAKIKTLRAPQPVAASDTAVPAHSILVKPDKAVDGAAYVTHMQTQLSALLAFDNANAKVRPITHSAFADALAKLRTMGNVAANAFAVANIEAAGKAAEAETQAA